ncbi:ABC transporter ATP-binding protein [Clostridium estertheticum]|uniref:ABC transporter ATP-binding protein n=1 Tax=Clostridium estertheticum TaxID=238834 RepID=UPI001CF28A63|nr:ABC transporter ATP-binding protein [Clostridium estertheticum]MCB2308698.1 ABC transporter ATP-binding protein [Clostridium estertheticum]MCB2347497.1 ABC transporter ATP-binding protein [Clostridium estertheticum]MCB2351683.1 ABC transporter ATP-binding protein [Clostridium estertheticum]WAG45349.1 ABC transporter ATP-binding protein [Clostridium estertheticum]
MTNEVLKIDNLKKTIGRRTIVSDICFELKKGEIFGFLGPNGAGKSTTIKMIVGLSKITEGSIYVGGCSVKDDFKGAMRNIGCIVENPDMYKYMSGLDNLKIFAKIYEGVDDSRIHEVVKIVDLERAIKDKVKTYSLGMKQRLGIAQALLHSPKLLILDEPTNGLDPAGIKEMRVLLRKLASETGLTVLVSSHILSEMQQMCDRVGIINKGKIITIKSVEELLNMTKEDDKIIMILESDDNDRAVSLLTSININSSLLGDGVHIETTKERVPEIVTTLTTAGIAILGMDKQETQSLEDVFMKLTGEGK